MADDDAALVRGSLAGDERCMRALVERFQGMVFGLCYRMLGRREDAEDVAQEVFLRVFRSLHRWDAGRPFKPWLLTIAANRCRTVLSNRSRSPVASEFVEQSAVAAATTDDDLAEELQLAIETLRDEYRTCFVLFYENELNCAQISEIMNCPPGTVKTWLHRARQKLADHLRRRGVVPDADYQLHRI